MHPVFSQRRERRPLPRSRFTENKEREVVVNLPYAQPRLSPLPEWTVSPGASCGCIQPGNLQLLSHHRHFSFYKAQPPPPHPDPHPPSGTPRARMAPIWFPPSPLFCAILNEKKTHSGINYIKRPYLISAYWYPSFCTGCVILKFQE